MIIQLGVPKSLGVPPNHPEIDHDLVMNETYGDDRWPTDHTAGVADRPLKSSFCWDSIVDIFVEMCTSSGLDPVSAVFGTTTQSVAGFR